MGPGGAAGKGRVRGMTGAALAPHTLSAVIGAYPGPALRVDAAEQVIEANDAARALFAAETPWWDLLAGRLGDVADGVVPPPSVQVATADGVVVVEWAVTRLPDGSFLLFGRDTTLERKLRQALTESRLRYKDLVEVSSDFAWESGADGRLVFVSPGGALGYAAEALVGRDPASLIIDGFAGAVAPFATRRPVNGVEMWMRAADGSATCVVASATPLARADGGWAGARGVCRDVTENRLRAAELARARNRERLLGHIMHALSNELDAARALEAAAGTTMRAMAAGGCAVFATDEHGTRPLVVAGTAPPGLIGSLPSGDDGPAIMACGDTTVLAAHCRYHQQINGAVAVWRADPPWGEDDAALIAGVAEQVGIVHAHVAFQNRLRRLSERDGLTGLLNRRTFLERLEAQLGQPRSGSGRPSALMFVDLDNFKAVNDRFGHHQGDAVLRTLGELLERTVRAGDLAARLGGDEFVLWLDGTDEDEARVIADRLLVAGQALLPFSAAPDRPLGLSVGVAIHRPGHDESIDRLIERADTAMYSAKDAGKGRLAIAP